MSKYTQIKEFVFHHNNIKLKFAEKGTKTKGRKRKAK